MQTNTIFGGSQSISAYLGMFGNGSAGVGALTGEVVADTIQIGHAIWHGTSVAAPNTGYWCGTSTFTCHFIGYNNGTGTTIQGFQPLASDSPTYGVIFGEKLANVGQSNVEAFFSTGPGTTCTFLAAPNGATEVGSIATYTCNAPIASPFVVGATAHIGGVGQSGYNIDCVILTVTTPSFTCTNSNIITAQFAITGASEIAGTATITTSGTCPFTTGETVTVANIINANNTANNGYNGAFTVLAPGCNGGNTFTYTNAVTGLPTCASALACTGPGGAPAPGVIGNPLPASGGGTAVASLRQAFTEYHDANGLFHWGYASPPAGNGVDAMTLTNTGVLGIVSINASGNIFVTGLTQSTFKTNSANQAASGQFRLASADTINWRNNANGADIALAKNASDQLTFNAVLIQPEIVATSAAFATATTAATCVQNTTAVAGATTAMAVEVSPVSTPGVGAQWSAFVSSAGNVTINECAVAVSAGGTIAFNIRVHP
jgi:hypothetical protein